MRPVVPNLLYFRPVLIAMTQLGGFGATSLATTGCVFPLQFDSQSDAGLDNNAPPNIVQTVPDMPSGIQPIDGAETPVMITVTLDDPDLTDVLHVRVFRDYDQAAAPPFVDKPVPATSARQRQVTFTTAAWCVNGTGQDHTFELLVSDRDFLDQQEPPLYRAVPDGAKTTRSFWNVQCL
jgi:hypothetical protein